VYVITEDCKDNWRYDIYQGYKLVVSGAEYFSSQMRATFAAIGHIVLLEKREEAMRVWIVTRKIENDWDEIEAVFLNQTKANEHIKVLETDFPHEEFDVQTKRVTE
jgi:hypothetical protein